MMKHNTYLDALKSDYRQMLAKLHFAKQNATGFHALSFTEVEEAKEAYQSEEGKKILRNAYKVYFALEKLEKELETVED